MATKLEIEEQAKRLATKLEIEEQAKRLATKLEPDVSILLPVLS